MGVAIGISLLSIQDKIYVLVFALLVNGGHFLFTPNPDVGEVFTLVSQCCWTSKLGVSVGSLVISHSNK